MIGDDLKTLDDCTVGCQLHTEIAIDRISEATKRFRKEYSKPTDSLMYIRMRKIEKDLIQALKLIDSLQDYIIEEYQRKHV